MILGIGTDIIEVPRVAEKMQRHQGFRDFVFSATEIAYCEKMTNKYEHYAARFAAKEAFLKALGKGWQSGTSFNEIEIIHNIDGKPVLHTIGETEITLKRIPAFQIHVSLSHVKEFAVAFVILEKL